MNMKLRSNKLKKKLKNERPSMKKKRSRVSKWMICLSILKKNRWLEKSSKKFICKR